MKHLPAILLATCIEITVCFSLAAEPKNIGASGSPAQNVPAWSDPDHFGPPAAGARGYPSRNPSLDALSGFRSPPPGYGEVPFWWWTGDPLDADRLLWQVEELHKKGISGMQVNYAHEDTSGWPTYPAKPEIFSPPWWEMWKVVAGRCSQRGMGIGLSGYTLDWPNGKSLVSRTIYSDPEIQGRQLAVARKLRVSAGRAVACELPADTVAVRAYSVGATGIGPENVGPENVDLAGSIHDQRLDWTPSQDNRKGGDWEVWVFTAARKPGTLSPIHPLAGRTVVEKFFQPFQDHAPGQSAAGLNYFFHDELKFGVGDRIWTDDLATEFMRRKGYDLFEALPAMFQAVGPKTVKYRLDFMDVKMQLAQERYFIPIFRWHWSRGKVYGCDQGSRGRNPMEFGDYFSSVRWYTAPGHDTPGGRADLIKGKVSSSIAHLYRRPRVWLEGYHSLGWGATPENLMAATCENYLYGCNLLNLHGLYYTTHGSFWEWAPPCYHFRMPYWDHMGTFLKYFERLSYLMSQGVHQCDVAVIYPVAPGQAGLGGSQATGTAFNAGATLWAGGYDFIFMDFESLARAEVRNGRLHVADASYRVLILPAMRAVRWTTLQKARAFFRAGGIVIAVEALPEASDHAGSEDPALDAVVKELFGTTAAEARAGARPAVQNSAAGGRGIALFATGTVGNISAMLVRAVEKRIPRDVESEQPVKATHRKVGPRDVYLVMGSPKRSECTFRATGRAELWDPWTGGVRPMHVVSRDATHTTLRMPLETYQAQIVVFTPGETKITVPETSLAEITKVHAGDGKIAVTGYAGGHADGPGEQTATVKLDKQTITLRGNAPAPLPSLTLEGEWESELKPTMDNRWGDFRLPATEKMIGAEARIFRYAEEKSARPGYQAREFDDSRWPRVTHGFGLKFWKLGPLPKSLDVAALEAKLAALEAVDPAVPVEIGGKRYAWKPYAFSWRWGKQGDPGHQGYHGLKENISDDFIRLGKPRGGRNETLYDAEQAGTRYYLWTAAVASRPAKARITAGGELKPAAVYLNGVAVADLAADAALNAGSNPLLLRYDTPGRGHFVIEDLNAPTQKIPVVKHRTPLSMTWYDRPGVLPLDAMPTVAKPAAWYRFAAPPGLRGMTLTAYGEVHAWADGRPVAVTAAETTARGAVRYRLVLDNPIAGKAKVALRIEPLRGYHGGSAVPEPVQLDCGIGVIALGDWSKGSALECYSGGLWYRKMVTLGPSRVGGRVMLDLGSVVASAEVQVNGQSAGVRVAPPWKLDITEFVRVGENRLEILVYNTLTNHYRTVPTRYRGNSQSGLIGPVRLEFPREVTLSE